MHPSFYDVFLHACLDADGEALRADPRAFLTRHGVPAEDAAAMATPARLGVYRMMVRNTLAAVVHGRMPRTRARMGERFDATFARFLAERGPQTHYLRDVPGEFLDFALPLWRAEPAIPAYSCDLARHELIEFTVATLPHERPEPHDEVALDRPLAFAEAVRLTHYAHAVHELPPGDEDRTVPAARDVSMLIYRDETHAVRFLELSPFAAGVVDELLRGAPLASALPAAAEAHSLTMDDGLLADIARLLADFGQRGILLGSRRA
jgi:hypothetical protein